MKKRILTNCSILLLAVVMCFQTVTKAYAASVDPGSTATEANVLEVLRQYDADAYYILKTEADSGSSFLLWFMGGSLISGIDTAVHETYHGYTFHQSSAFYEERIYLGNGKNYDVDYSVVYKSGNFTKTEEMARQIPSQLQTFRYREYVAPGAVVTANTQGVFGLLNEFTAYYWGLEAMNSLAQYLIDTNAGADAWSAYVSSIGNNMTAYAEFKYWTLRYMLYIKSANPSLYQAILNNENYCAAYRDAETQFVSEIARSWEIMNSSSEYLRAKKCSLEWSDSGIYLWSGNTGRGVPLTDYTKLIAELETAQYVEMDSVLKHTNGTSASHTFIDVPDWCAREADWAVENGITKGTNSSGTTFSPDNTCTDNEILTFLWRAAGEPDASSPSPFTVQSYYQDAVDWAYEQGMIDISYVPNAPCTRASAVNYIWQALGSELPNIAGSRFIDVPANADYTDAVFWAVENGITKGTNSSGTTFSPDKTCSRGEIITFLYRAYASEAVN